MKNLLWTLTSILILYSCSKDNEISNSDRINSDIKVVMIEGLSDSKNVLNINSETIEQQPCINHSLIAKHEINGNNIQIRYSGIYRPDICLTAIGPARTGYSFDLSNGNYNIEFINDNISNSALLSVDNEKYIIKMLSASNIIVERDTLYKIPIRTYWGTIGYHQESSEVLVDSFFDSLKQVNANFRTYKDGDYGYFTISDSNIQPPTFHGYYFMEAIIFEFDGNEEQLDNTIIKFAETYQDELSINIVNYQGKEISIWN